MWRLSRGKRRRGHPAPTESAAGPTPDGYPDRAATSANSVEEVLVEEVVLDDLGGERPILDAMQRVELLGELIEQRRTGQITEAEYRAAKARMFEARPGTD